jgi:hypothetical protein
MNGSSTFGRRGAAREPAAPRLPLADASWSRETAESDSTDESAAPSPHLSARKLIPAAVGLVALGVIMVVMVKFGSGAWSFECRPKPAAERSVFSIDWCRAATAAVIGGARGAAIGARNAPSGR